MPSPTRGDAAASPHPSRLSLGRPDRPEILRRHDAALARGSSAYLDPATRAWVFTSAYLIDRGTCCDTGCRHCPYVGAEEEEEPR